MVLYSKNTMKLEFSTKTKSTPWKELEDILPLNVDFSLIDGFTKVTDKDAAVYTRRIALEEGILLEIRRSSY
jgi:cysteine synthase